MSLTKASVSKILIVDDEPEIVAFIRELLTSRGYEVMGLSQPRDVPQQLDVFRPDLCIFDFRMPFLTGADLLDTVKKRDPSVEVIFLTAQDETSLAVDLMKRGALDFLLKPVELAQLLLSVGRALEHRRQRSPHRVRQRDVQRPAAVLVLLLDDALRRKTGKWKDKRCAQQAR